jgi:ABC-type uncharacterized transport system permease subunit
LISAAAFSLFLLAVGKSPLQFFELVHRGGFGSAISIQNTLQRAAPLILTALAVAIPARIGLVMIGGEGALVIGGFTSVPGVIVGGLIVGAAEKLAEVYLGPFVGGGIEGWLPYVLAVLFLLVRPEGLFGEKIIRRV